MKLKRKVALFDVDDTIYKGGIIYPLMESEMQEDLLDKKILEKAYLNKSSYQKGEISYKEFSRKGVMIWAQGLKGQSYAEVLRHAKEFIAKDIHNFYSFTKPLLALLKKSHDTIIITNEPQFVAQPISGLFNFTGYNSTEFETKDGKITGKVSRYNSTQSDKKKSIQEIFKKYNRKDSFAFGDSIGDAGMFEEVNYPICVNAGQKLQEVANKNGWKLTDPNNVIEIISKLLKKT